MINKISAQSRATTTIGASTIALAIVTIFYDSLQGWAISIAFALQFTCFVLTTITRKSDTPVRLLGPHFICITYVCVNLTLGPAAIEFSKLHPPVLHHLVSPETYFATSTAIFFTAFYLGCNLIAYNTGESTLGKRILPLHLPTKLETNKLRTTPILIAYSLLLVTFFSFVDLDFGLLGDGTFTVIPKTLGTVFLISQIARIRGNSRYLAYIFILALFSIAHFDNKREAIVVIIPILLCEALIASSRKNLLKTLALSAIAGAIGIAAIITMSIFRGYGGYNARNIVEASSHIPNYIAKPEFIHLMADHTEVSIAYHTAINSFQIAKDDPSQLLLGLTIVKPLLLPIPREAFPNKPMSMMLTYTSLAAPERFERGGSLPVTLYSELFYNLHILGILLIQPIVKGSTKLYLHLVKHIKTNNTNKVVWLLSTYTHYAIFIRGSGFEIYVFYTVLNIIFSIPFFILTKKPNSRNRTT